MIKLIAYTHHGSWVCTYKLCTTNAILGDLSNAEGACIDHLLPLITNKRVLNGNDAVFITTHVKDPKARHAIVKLLRVLSKGELCIQENAI